jgi:hypothetical protein
MHFIPPGHWIEVGPAQGCFGVDDFDEEWDFSCPAMSPWACTAPVSPMLKPIAKEINILDRVLLEFERDFMEGSDKIRKIDGRTNLLFTYNLILIITAAPAAGNGNRRKYVT